MPPASMGSAMAYDRKDHFYRRAKKEGKASRAVYKLAELQKRFRLVRKGDWVLDLGCAPGGWMQELSPMVGPKGLVIGIDLLPLKIQPPVNSRFVQGDITDPASIEKMREMNGRPFDVVLSDMAPNLSGVAFADAFRSIELARSALSIAREFLRPGGTFVAKVFPGEELAPFVGELKKAFARAVTVIPEATRKTSSERYLVAIGKKEPA